VLDVGEARLDRLPLAGRYGIGVCGHERRRGNQRRLRFGRRTSSPPQLGQVWAIASAHGAQKVHS
jgi:hypothetical protein